MRITSGAYKHEIYNLKVGLYKLPCIFATSLMLYNVQHHQLALSTRNQRTRITDIAHKMNISLEEGNKLLMHPSLVIMWNKIEKITRTMGINPKWPKTPIL